MFANDKAQSKYMYVKYMQRLFCWIESSDTTCKTKIEVFQNGGKTETVDSCICLTIRY